MSQTNYDRLLESAEKIPDSQLNELCKSLAPCIGAEDGSKDDEELALCIEATQAIVNQKTEFVRQKENVKIRRWQKDAIHYLRVVAYTGDLYKFCDESGDIILSQILERIIAILSPR